MNSSAHNDSQLSIVPLGAGDLIDRAVRFYRQNFTTFILIAAPPVVVATIVTVIWTMISREMFPAGSSSNSFDLTFYYLYVWFGAMVIWFAETVATLAVMGGASRNFVRHLLFGEAISFADTYRNTRERVFGLIAASSIITILLGVVGFFTLYFGLIAAIIVILLIATALAAVPPLAAIISVVVGLVIIGGSVWLFFLVASRFAYVPQVMLVEGQGVFQAIGRSATLASGNVKRLAALFIFTFVATYSALAILYVPLGWYAWVEGVEIFGRNADLTPAWFEIASQLVSQISIVVLSPIWMVGLCLLYVDERVRHEGYDIELMAARQLGEIPSVPQAYVNPLQPALGSNSVAAAQPASQKSSHSMLGLD